MSIDSSVASWHCMLRLNYLSNRLEYNIMILPIGRYIRHLLPCGSERSLIRSEIK